MVARMYKVEMVHSLAKKRPILQSCAPSSDLLPPTQPPKLSITYQNNASHLLVNMLPPPFCCIWTVAEIFFIQPTDSNVNLCHKHSHPHKHNVLPVIRVPFNFGQLTHNVNYRSSIFQFSFSFLKNTQLFSFPKLAWNAL